jgi:hypothetical protein
LTVKKGIQVGAGVVDADYRGPVSVVLFNLGDDDLIVQPGDRIAQLILEQIVMAPVEEVDELDVTVRGDGGFGSTGVEGMPHTNKKQKLTTNNISPSNSSDNENDDANVTMDDATNNDTMKQ